MNLRAESLSACPCGGIPMVTRDSCGWYVYCDDCYDGAPDARSFLGWDPRSCCEAIRAWNDAVDRE